ncbi:MAG: D-alanyl-D-alanine carboxypeptidase [Clostridia bacterium]|nr:D-alanyl-D-alanine carboxypeptidase [Clostridia bacterium]
MKRNSKRRFGLLKLSGLVSLIIIFVMLAPKDSDMLLGSPKAVLEGTSVYALSEKIAPESAAVFLDEELTVRNAYFCYSQPHSVIAEKDSGVRVAPASLTKIMTAIVILENADDLDVSVTVSPKLYDKLYREGASMAGFLPGEKVTLRDLLYGIMLPSGAEAAAAAAEYIAGSDSALVEMMNEKALEMGLSNTHFENIYGFDAKGHYSNAAELAQILMYALENERFREISSTQRYTVKPTNKHPDGFTMKSTVFSKLGGKTPDKAVIYGGKTGFTYDAGLCLATYGELDGRSYVSVVLGAPGNHRTEQKQVDDTLYLFDNFTY